MNALRLHKITATFIIQEQDHQVPLYSYLYTHAIYTKIGFWKELLVDYMTSGPVIAMVLEGNNAIKNVRKMCGNTIPSVADPSTIRGKFSLDSSDVANAQHRPVHNLIHASVEPEEAKYEISLWFGSEN